MYVHLHVDCNRRFGALDEGLTRAFTDSDEYLFYPRYVTRNKTNRKNIQI